MAKFIKNDSGTLSTYSGQDIQDGAYYEIQANEEVTWASNSTLLTDIGSGDAIVAKDDSGSNDITDVNDAINYLKDNPGPQDTEGHPVVKITAFHDANSFRARFKGISGTATKDSDTNIDYKITEDRFINGVRLILSDHEDGDYVTFQVVDVDNILGYGAGTVLDTFGDCWFVSSDICTQPDVLVPYPAKVVEDLYIRVKYHSVGTTNDVDVKANLFLHYKAT